MNITDFSTFYEYLPEIGCTKYVNEFKKIIETCLSKPNGNREKWFRILKELPDLTADYIKLNENAVTIKSKDTISENDYKCLKNCVKKLMPWRKGPYSLFDLYVDTEWRSDMKWNRLIKHIRPLRNKLVLDIGCGNGYHMFRSVGEQAKCVIGIDPSLLFLTQFGLIQKYSKLKNIFLLPVGVEHLPNDMHKFDTIFAMGVFYHRKSPFDFLAKLKSLLKSQGELILETLTVNGDENFVLVPENRYAQMRNVWFLPSVKTMLLWLKRAGFKNARAVDTTKTSFEEQRQTEFMINHSLKQALNPENFNETIEGYPAPVRTIFLAYL